MSLKATGAYKPPDFLTMECPKCGVVTWHMWRGTEYHLRPPVSIYKCLRCGKLKALSWDGRRWGG